MQKLTCTKYTDFSVYYGVKPLVNHTLILEFCVFQVDTLVTVSQDSLASIASTILMSVCRNRV